jgi:hypothetical protein
MNENLYSFFAVFALQSGSVAHFREDFTADCPARQSRNQE